VETIAKNLKAVAGLAQKAGPYLLLELLLPGGTLFALLLFVYRHRTARTVAAAASPTTISQMFAGMRRTLVSVQPYDIAAVANSDAANDADGLAPLAMVPGR
jgi:hypothetical protein